MPIDPADVRYTRDHIWLRPDGDAWRTGISRHAADELGQIVFVDLPPPGANVHRGRPLGLVESHKTASDLIGPADGVVLSVNPALATRPELCSEDPEGEGWLMKISIDEMSDDALTAQAYAAFLVD